jgi:hypothetical protein
VTEPAAVSLRDIIDAMGYQSDELSAYVECATGRVVVISEEAIRDAENATGDEPGGGPEELADAQAILRKPDDYVALPDRLEIDEYGMMVDFAAGIDSATVRGELQESMHGRGPFRRFKDAAHRLGALDAWYAYRDQRYEDVARAWCEEHGFAIAAPKADA